MVDYLRTPTGPHIKVLEDLTNTVDEVRKYQLLARAFEDEVRRDPTSAKRGVATAKTKLIRKWWQLWK